MKFKIKIIITIMVSFVVIVSMCFFVSNRNSISISGFNSDTIITGSNNSYLITLKGVPSGNGTYQQLITINNYSKYGINNNGSNIEFFDYSNYTHLYAWIQSINITTILIWIKNYNSSFIIDMIVFPLFNNLFNDKGFLGNSISNFNSVVNNSLPIKYIPLSDIFNGKIYYTVSTLGLPIGNSSFMETMRVSFGYNFSSSGYTDLIFFGRPSINNMNDLFIKNISGKYYFGFAPYGSLIIWNYSLNPFINYTIILIYSNGYHFYINGNSISVLSDNVPSTIDVYSSTSFIIGKGLDDTFVGTISYVGIMPSDYNQPTFTIVSLYHSIDFKLLGSPFSSLWNIMVNGTTYQADSSNIYLNMTNGYYNIIVNLPAGYSAITKGVLYVNGTNQVYKIFVSYNNNSGISNDIIYAIILASIIVAAAIYFSKRS